MNRTFPVPDIDMSILMPEDAPDQLAVALVSCCHEGSHSTGCHSVQGEGGQGEQEGDNLKETGKVWLLPSSKD